VEGGQLRGANTSGDTVVRKSVASLFGVLILSMPSQFVVAVEPSADVLAEIAKISQHEDMMMIPMRDGIRLYSQTLFPNDTPRSNLPTILFRTPYLTDREPVRFAPYVKSLLKNGYAVMFQSERGRYFSEGTYTYLARSGADGYDTVEWIAKQPWSNGKIGTLGCSGTAEEQHRLNAANAPHLAATVPIGSGAGIGHVGPYDEHGNFYRGGAIQMGWFNWYYGSGYRDRPMFAANKTREEMIQLHRYWNLQPSPPDSGIEKNIWTLPVNEIMAKMGAAPSDLDDFVNRAPNDPRWKELEVGNEGDLDHAPMLMINSWYDISVGPNVAMFTYQTEHAATEIARENMFMVIAPTAHCAQGRVESEHTVIGERDLGDARFDYVGLVQRWFDHWLKDADNGVQNEPKVRAYMMGENRWESFGSWPPKPSKSVRLYLDSDGHANSGRGDGRLVFSVAKESSDAFDYDPAHPVESLGGGQQGWGVSTIFKAGSDDQSSVEEREDVLVYTSAPLKQAARIMGPISADLYLSSDRKDTDLTVKLIDVYPDGRAYNLDDSVQRVRWRNGYTRPEFMEPGKVYRVSVGPLVTGNTFERGHQIRVEVSSSNFPFYERNLNTGGNNISEPTGVVAHNVIHHGTLYPSAIVMPYLR
jgi:putative CocE/NonD family hydrolase